MKVDLLKEAIADAKTLRETAIENAKMALKEAFTPKIQSMFNDRVNEIESEDDEEELAKEGLDEKAAEGDDDKNEPVEVDEAKKDDDSEEDDSDLDEILREIEAEEVSEAAKADEDEPEEVDEAKKDDDSEEDLDLDEILREIEAETNEAKKDDDDSEELAELRHTIKVQEQSLGKLKSELNEINLLNAKLLYTNKLFNKYDLTPKQKLSVLEALDRSNTTREAKLIFATLTESFSKVNVNRNVKRITESIASRAAGNGFKIKDEGSSKKIISESATATRFQELANIL